MRRSVLPIAALTLLATAACGGHTKAAAPIASTLSPRPVATTSQAAPATTTPSTAKPKPQPSASAKSCEPTRDVLVWMKTPGVPAAAQVLGNYSQINCETTFQWLKQTSPTDAGDCTEAAWASDNPGYNADATPAARLKKVQVAIGPAC